jgi:acetyl-CoA C-acetyltransferase
MGERCAIVGIGQSDHKRIREDLSMAGLLREAASRALADAEMDWSDIQAIVFGKAPDQFEGVMMPELYLADALGGAGKPMIRMHTAGSVGAHTAIFGAHLIESGLFDCVLSIAFEKQSETDTSRVLSAGQRGGAAVAFAPSIRQYIERSHAPEYIGWMVAVKDRLNALKNPHAQIHMPDITIEKVQESEMVADPLRRLECCPTSDGAAAIIYTNERRVPDTGRRPAWVLASATRSEAMGHPGRDWVSPLAGQQCAKEVYRQAGITNPLEEIDTAEIYVPFTWFEPMWLENLGLAEVGTGWKLTDGGDTAMDGAFPVNPSGGVLSANAIGAAGLIRCAEAAMQARGTAGEHQIPDVRVAMGHAFGGGSQYFAIWLVGSEKPD